SLFLTLSVLPSRPMIRRALVCLITFGLVACATPPKAPPTAAPAASGPRSPQADAANPPAEASVERVADVPIIVEDFATARANFIRDTAARYGIDPQYIDSVLSQAVIRDDVIALMSRPAERV